MSSFGTFSDLDERLPGFLFTSHQESTDQLLGQGLGKLTANRSGWTMPVPMPYILHTEQQIIAMLTAEMQGMVSKLMEVLAPFPEARLPMAKALIGGERPALVPLG
jgi:hypothetical protein